MMGRIAFACLIFLCGCTMWTECAPIEHRVDYTGHRVVTVWPRNLAQLQLLSEIEEDERYEIDFWSEPVANRSIDLHIPPSTYPEVSKLLQDAQIHFRIKIADIESLIATEDADVQSEEESLATRHRRQAEDTTVPEQQQSLYYAFSVVGQYSRHEQINMWLEAAENEFPNIATVVEIGNSYEHRPLKVLKISSGGNSNKSAIWIDAGIHAREWIAPATAIYIIDQLLTGYDVNETVTNMVDTFDWYILPVVNPDGYEYSHTIDRLWRKTRRPNYGLPRCIGVDANRNFNYAWAGACAFNMFSRCSSVSPCRTTFRGETSFSEPETSAMADFLLEHKQQLKVYISFHSYSQLWLTNWGASPILPADNSDLIRVARKGTAALREKYGTSYTIGSPARILYVAGGTSYDWAKAVAGIKYSYTLELRDKGHYGFLLPRRLIIPSGQEIWDAMEVVAAEVAKEISEPEVEVGLRQAESLV